MEFLFERRKDSIIGSFLCSKGNLAENQGPTANFRKGGGEVTIEVTEILGRKVSKFTLSEENRVMGVDFSKVTQGVYIGKASLR